ncbi:hypothetical protein ACTFIU_002284 [Dictyostelium citrinum]
MKAELDISELKKIISGDKKTSIFKFLNSLVVAPFRNISIYAHSPFVTNFKEISVDISNIFKKHGYTAFLRGSIFYDLTTIVETVIRSLILNCSFKFNIFKNEKSKSFQLSNEILKLYLEYPKKMLFHCLVLSKVNIKLIQIIRLFLLHSSSSSSSSSSFLSLTKLYGTIYHGSFYSIMLMLSSKFLDDYVSNKLDNYLNNYFNNNNNNNNKLYKPTKIIIKSLVRSLVVSPIYVIDSIYPSQVISSLVLNEATPLSVDPVSIAISIFKNQGVKYFYKGLLPQFGLELLTSYFNS